MGLEMAAMVRFGVSLPEWYERKLKIWATLKGTNRATLAANIVQSRIEANWPDIEKEIEAIARHKGITLEQPMEEWSSGDDK